MGIAEIKLELQELENKIHAKRKELYEAEAAALPWKVGDVVRFVRGRYGIQSGSEWKITGVYNAGLGWARGVGRKKDGTWGVRERTLYDRFEIVQP